MRERSVLEEQSLWGLTEQLEIQRNQLGAWEISLHLKGTIAPGNGNRLRLEKDFSRAVAWADSWVRRQRPHVVVLLDANAGWNHRPATPAQIAALQRRGYPAKSLRGITKGEAAMLFSKSVPSFLKLSGAPQRS